MFIYIAIGFLHLCCCKLFLSQVVHEPTKKYGIKSQLCDRVLYLECKTEARNRRIGTYSIASSFEDTLMRQGFIDVGNGSDEILLDIFCLRTNVVYIVFLSLTESDKTDIYFRGCTNGDMYLSNYTSAEFLFNEAGTCIHGKYYPKNGAALSQNDEINSFNQNSRYIPAVVKKGEDDDQQELTTQSLDPTLDPTELPSFKYSSTSDEPTLESLGPATIFSDSDFFYSSEPSFDSNSHDIYYAEEKSMLPTESFIDSSDLPTLFPTELPTGPDLIPTVSSSDQSQNPTEGSWIPSEIPISSQNPSYSPIIFSSAVTIDSSISPSSVADASGVLSSFPTEIPWQHAQESWIPSETPIFSKNPSYSPAILRTAVPTYSSISPSSVADASDILSSFPTQFPSSVSPKFPSFDPTFASLFISTEPSVDRSNNLPTLLPSTYPSTSFSTSYPSFSSNLTFQEVNDQILDYAIDSQYSYYFYDSISCDSEVYRTSYDWSNLFAIDFPSIDESSRPSTVALFIGQIQCPLSHAENGLNIASSLNTTVCTEFSKVQLFWSAMLGEISDISFYCDNHRWSLGVCNSARRVCVDCDDLCSSIGFGPIYADDISNHRGNPTLIMSGIGLTVVPKPATWITWSQTCRADFQSPSIQVEYILEKPGILTCNYGLYSPVQGFSEIGAATSVLITTIDKVAGTLFVGVADKEIALSNEATYMVSCFTQSFDQSKNLISRSPVSESIAKSCNISSPIKRGAVITEVGISIPFTKIPLKSVSPPVTIKVDSIPSDDIIIYPSAQYLGHSNCNNLANVERNTSLIAYRSLLPEIAPASLLFTPTSPELFQLVYFKFNAPGCYFLSANVTGKSVMSSYNSISPYVFVPDVNPTVTVSATTIAFIRNGFQLQLTFDGSTDRGASQSLDQGVWPCSILLDFPYANVSQCSFSSPSALKILLKTDLPDSLLLHAGSEVQFLGGPVKPQCLPDSIYDCGIIPFILPAKLIVSSALEIYPLVQFMTPASIKVNQSLYIDLSLVTGSGGRPWTQVIWSVQAPTYDSSTALNSVMNSGAMAWFHCIPESFSCNKLRSNLFLEQGFYTFSLSVMSFFGAIGSGYFTIEVLQSTVPEIAISNPSYSVVFANSSITLAASLSEPIAPNIQANLVWSVYSDNVLEPALSVYGDRFLYSIPPYILSAGRTYRFSVRAIFYSTLDGISAIGNVEDSTIISISPGECIAKISGATLKSYFNNQTIVLDASSSYSTATGNADNLRFTWQCMQLEPLDFSGCTGFRTILNSFLLDDGAMQPTIVFSSTILTFPAKYVFSVSVASINGDSAAATGSKFIETAVSSGLSNTMLLMRQSKSKLDLIYPMEISAMITFDTPVVAEWGLSLNGEFTSLASRSFPSALSASFPLVIRYSKLPPLRQFTFQLKLSSYSAATGVYGEPAFGEIVIVVNKPPSLGFISSSPLTGDESESFTLYALNWYDEDLPLTYRFYYLTQALVNGILLRDDALSSYCITTLPPSLAEPSTIRVYISDNQNAISVAETSLVVSTGATPSSLSSIRLLLNSYQQYNKQSDLLTASENVLQLSDLLSCHAGDFWADSNCADLFRLASNATRCMLESSSYFNEIDTALVFSRLAKLLASFLQASSLDSLSASIRFEGLQQFQALAMIQISDLISGATSLIIRPKQLSSQYLNILKSFLDEHIGNLARIVVSLQSIILSDNLSLRKSMFYSVELFYSFIEQQIVTISNIFFHNAIIGDDTYLAHGYFDVFISRYISDGLLPENQDQLQAGFSVLSFSSSFTNGSRPNSFSSAQYLIVRSKLRTSIECQSSIANDSLSNCPIPSDKIFIEFESSTSQIPSNYYNASIALNRSVNSIDRQVVAPKPVSINVTCSDYPPLSHVNVSCSSHQTGGPAYSFPSLDCGSNISSGLKSAVFQCPLYTLSPICIVNGVKNTDCQVLRVSDGAYSCLCPLNRLNASSGSYAQSINAQASKNFVDSYFRLSNSFISGTEQKLIMPASVIHHDNDNDNDNAPLQPSKAPTNLVDLLTSAVESGSTISTLAIAIISVLFTMFAAFGARRIRKWILTDDVVLTAGSGEFVPQQEYSTAVYISENQNSPKSLDAEVSHNDAENPVPVAKYVECARDPINLGRPGPVTFLIAINNRNRFPVSNPYIGIHEDIANDFANLFLSREDENENENENTGELEIASASESPQLEMAEEVPSSASSIWSRVVALTGVVTSSISQQAHDSSSRHHQAVARYGV